MLKVNKKNNTKKDIINLLLIKQKKIQEIIDKKDIPPSDKLKEIQKEIQFTID